MDSEHLQTQCMVDAWMLKQTAVMFQIHSLGENGGGVGKMYLCPNAIISFFFFLRFILCIPILYAAFQMIKGWT